LRVIRQPGCAQFIEDAAASRLGQHTKTVHSHHITVNVYTWQSIQRVALYDWPDREVPDALAGAPTLDSEEWRQKVEAAGLQYVEDAYIGDVVRRLAASP
jgi:hypothetical protein